MRVKNEQRGMHTKTAIVKKLLMTNLIISTFK